MKDDYNDVKEEIIVKALEVFTKYGYKKTTMNDIAKAVGKAKSSIYHYFNSKDEIFKAIVIRESKVVRSLTAKIMDSVEDAREKLKVYSKVHYEHKKELVCLSESLISEFFEAISIASNEVKQLITENTIIVENIITLGNKQGHFNVKDTRKAAMAFQAMLFGAFNPAMPLDKYIKTEEVMPAMLELFITGLKHCTF